MKKKRKKVIYFSASAIAVFLISLALSYGTGFSDPVSGFFKNIYPQVIVGRGMISISYWNKGHELAEKLDPNESREKVSDQLIKVKQQEQLLAITKVSYLNPIFDEELLYYKTGKQKEFQNIINKYFNFDEELFREYVAKPEVYDTLLRIKYNSDFSANEIAYAKAQSILMQLSNGGNFEQLAKTESGDLVSGQLGGDLGFVTRGQLLPELEKAILNAPLGQTLQYVVVSRLGYHILYPVEIADQDGQKVWHIKHILVQTSGYDNWLRSKLNKFWVWRIK
ncbi:MAG: peptidylprolyl isomerase [Candidatus Doudnabacteria bacterium]